MLSNLATSQAAGSSELRQKLFETGDTNSDSILSGEELAALFTAHLGASIRMGQDLADKVVSSLDQNGDGQVSQAEFGLGQSGRFSAEVGKAVLSQQEAANSGVSAQDVFAAADKDGDGVLSQDEILAMFKKNPEKDDEETLTKLFAKLDMDGDGKVGADEVAPEKSEAPAADEADSQSGVFNSMDLNHDGRVSAAEWAKAAEKRTQWNTTSTDLSAGKLDSPMLAYLLDHQQAA